MTRQKEIYIFLIALVFTLCILTIIMLLKVHATNNDVQRVINNRPAHRGVISVSHTL